MIIKKDKLDFQKYLIDESNLLSKNIEKLYIPEIEEEVDNILQKEKNITIYGGGTGVVGGVITEDGVLLSTEKLKKLAIDKKNKIVTVGAGITLKELSEELFKNNLWYPVDSTEQTATIGGNVATNASGTRSFKYGNIRNFVNSIKLYLPSGEKIFLKRGQFIADGKNFNISLNNLIFNFDIYDLSEKFSFKNTAGYFMKKNMDLIDLFIGSEGTLGVIIEIELKVLDLPYDIYAFLIYFDERQKCFEVIENLKKLENEFKPLSIEFFDKNSLEFLKIKIPNIKITDSVIITEFLVDKKENEEKILNFVDSFFKKNDLKAENIFVTSSKYKNDFIYNIREKLPQIINEYIKQKNLKKISTDFAVRQDFFYHMIEIYDKILGKSKIKYVVFGHIGDNNLHINFLPENMNEFLKAIEIYATLVKEICNIGGTISAEHGIGKLKKKYLKYMYDECVINKMKEIKKIFDPELKLNRGNIFDI